MKTPTIPAALALVLALIGPAAAQDNPYNMGTTADGKTIVAPGTYGPFQGPTCEAGSSGCAAAPSADKPKEAQKKDISETACLATSPLDPAAMAAAIGAMVNQGVPLPTGDVKAASAAKPGAPKEEPLPNGDSVVRFPNGDVSYCSASSCSIPGPAANNPQYQQYLASKAQKEADKKSVEQANCKMFACDKNTKGDTMSAMSTGPGAGTDDGAGVAAASPAAAPGGASTDGSESSDSDPADYSGMGSVLASGGPASGGGEGARAGGAKNGPSAETTMGQEAMASSGQLAAGRAERAALASQYSYVRLQKAITNNSGLDDVARFGASGNASGPDDAAAVVPGGTRASANR